MPYKDKEKLKAYQIQYRINHKEHKKEWSKQYYQDNKEKIKEYKKQWCLNNSEHKKEYDKQYRLDHSEHRKQYGKQYFQTPEGKASNQRGKSKRRANEANIINTLTAEEWIEILKEYKFKCAYCGKKFTLFDRETRDHVIPISKGGNNTKENIVPACRSCNTKKYNKILLTKPSPLLD